MTFILNLSLADTSICVFMVTNGCPYFRFISSLPREPPLKLFSKQFCSAFIYTCNIAIGDNIMYSLVHPTNAVVFIR